MLNYIEKPYLKDSSKIYPFVFPDDIKDKAKMICFKRRISLAEFVRESIVENIKKYNKLFKQKI